MLYPSGTKPLSKDPSLGCFILPPAIITPRKVSTKDPWLELWLLPFKICIRVQRRVLGQPTHYYQTRLGMGWQPAAAWTGRQDQRYQSYQSNNIITEQRAVSFKQLYLHLYYIIQDITSLESVRLVINWPLGQVIWPNFTAYFKQRD